VLKLLIIKPSSLGDIIHALRVLSSIKEELPNSKVSWVVRDIFAQTVRTSGLVDHVFEFQRGGGLFAYLGLIRQLRRQRFDYVFDMQGLFRSGVLTGMSRASQKWGRKDGREGSTFFYKKVDCPQNPGTVHAIDVLLAFKEALDLKPILTGQLSFPFANLSDENEALVEEITRNGALPLVTVFPESRRAEKEWPHFDELTRRLAISSEVALALAGCRVASAPQCERFLDFTGKTSLEELPALLERSSVVLANDSAPLHFASALERPLIGLFGPTNPLCFGPYPPCRVNSKVLKAPLGDLSLLSVDEVEQSVFSLLTNV
jgi:heptosyltransferase I